MLISLVGGYFSEMSDLSAKDLRLALNILYFDILSYIEYINRCIRDLSSSNNNILIEFLKNHRSKFEAELLDIEIKLTFPDYIPPWEQQ